MKMSHVRIILALNFFFLTSLGVSVSALAKTGTILTFSCRAFMNSTSRGRRLEETQHVQIKKDTCRKYFSVEVVHSYETTLF